MTRRTNAAIAALLLVLAAGCGKAGPKPAGDVEFSALLVIQEQGAVQQYNVSFTREKQRLDTTGPAPGTGIIRHDKGVIWTLMPSVKMFIEMPLKPENKNPLMFQPDNISGWRKLGEETVEGHPAIKETMVMQNEGGKEMDIYRWFATDLNWPIKAEAVDGSWRLAYRDIKLEKQDPSLFEIPDGYRQIQNRRPSHMKLN